MNKPKKRTRRMQESKFVKALVEGKTQVQAYKESHPNAKEISCYSNASTYAKRPSIQKRLQAEIDKIEAKDISAVIKSVVKDAKGSKKDVVYNSSGEKTSIKDNTATIASREQLFKLAGHQAYSKTTNVNVAAAIPPDYAEAMNKALDRMDKVIKNIGGLEYDDDYGRVDVIDAEYTEDTD